MTKATHNLEAEIFVVDNNSTDGSKDFFKDKFNAVKFFWNNKNTGFAKANNAAFEQATGEYILFLNPDTIIPEDCFEKCISFFKAKPAAGAIGIRMIDGKGNFLKESKRSFPSPLTSFYKLFGLAELFPRSKTFSKYHLGNLDENSNHEADVLAGAFLMASKKVLEKTGAFDEAFFMYGEDIDLSFRIKQAGFKNYYFAEATIIHFKGESTQKESLNYTKMFYKAMSVFVKKHYGKKKAGVFNFLIQIAILFRAIVSVAGKIFKRTWLYIKDQLRKNDKKRGQIIIIGSEEEFAEIQNILAPELDEKTPHVLNIKVTDEPGIDKYIEQLYYLNKLKPAGEVVLCQGKLSFKNIIELTEKIPKSVNVKFHSYGSKSIIGTGKNLSLTMSWIAYKSKN